MRASPSATPSAKRESSRFPTLVHVVFTLQTWVGAGSKRVRGDIRTIVGDLGMLTITFGSGAVRCCDLHHRRLLVHGVNLVRESCSNRRPFLVRHLRGD